MHRGYRLNIEIVDLSQHYEEPPVVLHTLCEAPSLEALERDAAELKRYFEDELSQP